MSKQRAAFEQDRQRMLRLLREMDTRVAEVVEDSSIGDIGTLVRELNEADLSVRLGLADSAFFIEQRRDHPRYELERTLVCNDPHGTRADLVQLSAVLKDIGLDPVAQRSKADDRRRLRRALARWIRVVEALEEPAVYPSPPRYMQPGVDYGLWADPLWRALHRTITTLEQDIPICWGPEHGDYLLGLIGRINQLTSETGRFPPFRRATEPRLGVFDKDDEHVLDLQFDGKGGIVEPTPDDLPVLVRCLEGWRAARGMELEERRERDARRPAAHTGEGSAASSVPQRLDDEPSKGMLSSTDLAKQHGLDSDRVRKALERYRRKNLQGWVEVTERGPREPQFLYDAEAVEPILARMLERPASGETSG